MTVTVSYSPLTYNCNGSATAFSVTWPFFLSSDLVVTHITSGGVETVLALTTDYTVSGGRDSTTGLPAVGTVTTLSTYASGVKIRITRSTPRTQSTSFTTAGAFPAKTVEAMIDRVHMIAEEGAGGSPAQDVDGASLRLETGGATDYWDAEGYILRNLAEPTGATDAATKDYVDTVVAGAAYPTPIDIESGGTGVETLTQYGVVVGNGTNPVHATAAGASGYALLGNGSANPTFQGFVQSGASAVTRTWQTKLREAALSVKDFGAVGDGSTDDTAAIQAAIDSFGSGGVLATANGGVLLFPPGLFKITGGLLIQQTGVRVVGASQDATKIVAAGNLGTAAVFEWDQTNSGYSQVGCGIENLRIDMAGFTGHGVWMHKAYDGVTLTNVYVDNVGDAYNAFRFEEDSGVTDQISQTITLTNCCGIHQNATADEPVFYFQNVQEALLQSCKGFGTYEANGKATCYPFEFIDCRGVVMTKCSAAFADRHGIYFRTSTRVSSGITIIGPTFETIDGAILVSGGVNGEVSNLRVINPRTEGTVANAAGAIDLNKVYRSHLETNSLTVNLDASCQRVVIESDDDTQVTDAGTQTTVIGWTNGVHANYRVAPAIYSNNVIAGNTGLKALDTNSSHAVAFVPGSNVTADRTVTFTGGDQNVTLDLAGSTTNPTCTPGGGSFTTVTATVKYWKIGTMCFICAEINLTNIGTGAGDLIMPLPITATGSGTLHGRESASTGLAVQGSVANGSTTVSIWKYDFTSILGSGRTVKVSGVYPVAA